MIVTNVLGLTDISDEAAEIIAGGFDFINFDIFEEEHSSGTVGRVGERVRTMLDDEVDSSVLTSEQMNGFFLIEVPSLNFSRTFAPNTNRQLPEGDVEVFRNQLPSGVNEATEIFITDLGAPFCVPAANPSCRNPDRSMGGGSVVSVR